MQQKKNQDAEHPQQQPTVEAWWKCLSGQVLQFFASTDSTSVCAALRAVENISSMGIWFTEDLMAMHRRLYMILTFSHVNSDDAPVYSPLTVSGLCNFSYCNYVSDSRRQRQLSTLASIAPAKLLKSD
mmetsp:Transcript_60667/g.70344  ORF Transcript_60667/g.70344 Transcript_60667/m.70344 type:complete len:128 (+) Transcript_60667:1-384(+)|eukprot:CAMPEP_0176412432 /NCGR_PEP_ID=MMETSP0127-20121128/4140_1 /TAXON_ID=938130 /ORGANISM="Platyophrya macrostoma, Strain WH" /LENGTH=127 /DNA_ID=CAMNT_0017792101 /DNA_START=1 /DNA_END=384 /DNA_ORIENTATION=+